MPDLTYDELRQIELALIQRLSRLERTPPSREGKLHEHHVRTSSSALLKVIKAAAALRQDG